MGDYEENPVFVDALLVLVKKVLEKDPIKNLNNLEVVINVVRTFGIVMVRVNDNRVEKNFHIVNLYIFDLDGGIETFENAMVFVN